MARPKKTDKVVEPEVKDKKGPKLSHAEIKAATVAKILEEYSCMVSAPKDRTDNLFKLQIPSLNAILGGGLPRGQMIHLYGAQGAGKSTLAQQIIQSVQAAGGNVLLVDAENTMHSPYMKAIGIDCSPEKLTLIDKITTAEDVLDMIEKMVRADGYSLVVVDTVAALLPASILESSNSDASIGVQARMMSMALLKLNNAAVNSGTIILFVNQLRANISPMPNAPKSTTPGGNALKFYCNIELRMSRVGSITEGAKVIGQEVKIEVMKNKIAPPMRNTVCNLIYGEGFTRDSDLILAAKDAKIIDLAGSWFTYGTNKWQGLSAIKEYAKEHPEFLNELEAKLYGDQPVIVPEEAKSVKEEPVAD